MNQQIRPKHLPSLWTSEPHTWVWILTWLVAVQQVPSISKPCFPHSGDGAGDPLRSVVRRCECPRHSGAEDMSIPVLAPGLSPSLCLLLATLSSVEPLRQTLLKALLICAQQSPRARATLWGSSPLSPLSLGWFKRDAGLWALAS